MTDESLRRRIADVAGDSSRVRVTRHARQRMRKRRILLSQVLEVLRGGYVTESAHRDVHGNWCCKLERRTAGDVIGVPCALVVSESGEVVIVITAMR